MNWPSKKQLLQKQHNKPTRVSIRVAQDNHPISSVDVQAPSVLVVGRHSDCGLRLDADLVSRTHARLILGASSFILQDTSANGTVIGQGGPNAQVLHGTQQELKFGSVVRIGPFVLTIGTGSPPPAKAAASSSGLHELRPVNTNGGGGGVAAATSNRSVDHITSLVGDVALRRRIHKELLQNLDFAKIDPTKNSADDPSLRSRVVTALKRIVNNLGADLPPRIAAAREEFIGELAEEALGLGPLEPLLADPTVTEIMVVDPLTIYVERLGRLELTNAVFTDDERVRAVIERIVAPLGRRIDESQPLVDARLRDGSRVNAIIRPLALRGTCITIRKFPKRRLGVEDLIELGSVTPRMARFLEMCVAAKKNVLISGGTGSGKTTLLNIMSTAIPAGERIVTIEDAAELQLDQPHVVSLETKLANMEGKGAFTIRDLVRNALRMRPDRIIVGECRGGEALDMLQAMNTGHDGSLTTIHANSPAEALGRLETLALMAGLDLPSRAIREQIARCIHVIVQQTRLSDGSRKVTHISEIDELDASNGTFEVRTIFEYERSGVREDGSVTGDFQATGYLPTFVDELLVRGLLKPGESLL
jgi:pilus assembly protein CpaF